MDFLSVFKKEFSATFKLIPIVLGGMVTPLFIYFFFSSMVDNTAMPNGMMSYSQYMVSGTILFQLVYSTFYNASYSTFFSSNITQTMDELLTSPISSRDILLGRTLSTSLTTVMVSIPLLAILIYLSKIPFHIGWYLFTSVILVIIAMIFSLLGTFLGLLVNSEFSLINIANMIIIPITFISDTFIKVSGTRLIDNLFYLSPIKLGNDIIRDGLILHVFNYKETIFLFALMVIVWLVVYKVFDNKSKL
jgi:ABC-type multidrug transport system permease subunit